jgi:peptidyl-tRNA hydrolase
MMGNPEMLVNTILSFMGGLAAGWALHAVAGGEGKRSSSNGSKGSKVRLVGRGRPSTAPPLDCNPGLLFAPRILQAKPAPRKKAAAKGVAVGSSRAASGKGAAGGGGAAAGAPRPRAARPAEELKMVLCVNQGLGMGKGKIGERCRAAAVPVAAPQAPAFDPYARRSCANAAGCRPLQPCARSCPPGAQCAHAAVGVVGRYGARAPAAFRAWEACGQPKISLKVKDEAEMVRHRGGEGAEGVGVLMGESVTVQGCGARSQRAAHRRLSLRNRIWCRGGKQQLNARLLGRVPAAAIANQHPVQLLGRSGRAQIPTWEATPYLDPARSTRWLPRRRRRG